MPSPLLRGADAVEQGAATDLFDVGVMSPLTGALMSNMGNSSRLSFGKPLVQTYGDYKLPVIPPGVPTTIIPVAFPLTRAPVQATDVVQEEAELVIVFFLALMIWMLPTLCINKRLCCSCFTRFMSRRLGTYFCIGLIINFTAISLVIAYAPHIEANSLFFEGVSIFEKAVDSLTKVLTQLAALAGLVALWLFRKKIAQILGLDQQIVKASLRDLLTGFSMKRFRAIEISLWKAEGLPVGVGSKTLFTRMTLGFNEAVHTRPHDGIQETFVIKERVQMNYDPQDDTQKLSIMIKQQEVIGAQINQFMPAVGAIFGGAGGMTTPLGPTGGAIAGAAAGLGAANSFGAEIARVDLSSAMMNRMRDRFHGDEVPNPSSERPQRSGRSEGVNQGPRWSDSFYQSVDLIPQGKLWLRLADISDYDNRNNDWC